MRAAFVDGSIGAGGTCVHDAQAVASMTATSSRKLVRAERLIRCRAEEAHRDVGRIIHRAHVDRRAHRSVDRDAAVRSVRRATD
jgi:hypothetical protein